jgi:hypothetical protein
MKEEADCKKIIRITAHTVINKTVTNIILFEITVNLNTHAPSKFKIDKIKRPYQRNCSWN